MVGEAIKSDLIEIVVENGHRGFTVELRHSAETAFPYFLQFIDCDTGALVWHESFSTLERARMHASRLRELEEDLA